MRKAIKFLLKCVVLIALVAVLLTFGTDILGGILDTGTGVITTTQMTHELREMGMLTAHEYTDTGVFVSSTPAIIIGEAQRVTVPYTYTIAYGVDLEQAAIRTLDDGLLAITLPSAEMTHDALRVTGDIEVKDFLFPLTETRYQEILDEQQLTFRQAYLDDPAYAQAAHETARDKVKALLDAMLQAQGLGDTWSIVFEDAQETGSVV